MCEATIVCRFLANLDMMVRWYNKVRQTMLHVEFPLIRNELMDIDKEMEKGEQILRWKDDSTLEKENTSTLDLTIMYQMA
jgi:hypothetical protein